MSDGATMSEEAAMSEGVVAMRGAAARPGEVAVPDEVARPGVVVPDEGAVPAADPSVGAPPTKLPDLADCDPSSEFGPSRSGAEADGVSDFFFSTAGMGIRLGIQGRVGSLEMSLRAGGAPAAWLMVTTGAATTPPRALGTAGLTLRGGSDDVQGEVVAGGVGVPGRVNGLGGLGG